MGQDPLRPRAPVTRRCGARSRACDVRAIGAVDVALWDLAGKVAGPADPSPARHLPRPDAAPMPARRCSPSPAGLCRAGAALTRRRLGRLQDPSADATGRTTSRSARRCARRSATTTRSCSIRPGPTTIPAALRVGRAIEELGFYWYEDPLADQDIYNYVKLKQQLAIPILATEYPIARPRPPTRRGSCRRPPTILRGDVAVKGGITTLVKTAHLAEAFRMNYEVHHGGNSLNNVANLHVIMAIRNTRVLRGAAARRRAEVRPGAGHRGRPRRHGPCARPRRASAPRSTSS